MNAEERAAYNAAMEENALLRAVLDNLRGEGSVPATTSRRRCVEPAGDCARRQACSRPACSRSPRASKSSYEYHWARSGAALRDGLATGSGSRDRRRSRLLGGHAKWVLMCNETQGGRSHVRLLVCRTFIGQARPQAAARLGEGGWERPSSCPGKEVLILSLDNVRPI